MIALGVDAGASSSRWLLTDDGREIARGRSEPITGHLFTDAARERMLARVAAVCREVRAHGAPDRVAAGITGLDQDRRATQLLADAFAAGLGISRDRVLVLHDMVVAYHAVFRPGEGILVYGGTGSVAYHVPARDQGAMGEGAADEGAADEGAMEAGATNAGRAPGAGLDVRIGGHGYLIDDAGGGFWIGQRALRWWVREHDRLGRPPATPLARAVQARSGGETWEAIREHVYGGDRSAVAAFAADVGTAAAAGDAVATEILHEAGGELARLAFVAFARLGRELPVTLAGGVAHLGSPLSEALRAALPATVAVGVSTVEPVEAAARLASTPLG